VRRGRSRAVPEASAELGDLACPQCEDVRSCMLSVSPREPVGFHNRVMIFDLQRHGRERWPSCCWFVLVDQSARDPAASYSRRGRAGGRDGSDLIAVRCGRCWLQCAAYSALDRAQLSWPGDQHPAGVLGPGCAHPASGTGVRSRAARRDRHHLDPGTRQRHVERPGELPGPVPRARNRNRPPRSPGSISRFRACRTARAPSGCAVTPGT
jgi:hypothetical protein